MTEDYHYDWYSFDRELMKDFNWFLQKIDRRACIEKGIINEDYDPVNRRGEYDPGLERGVEWFHPVITLDDRMRYIAEVIANHPTSRFNILGNTIISHFYGARGVHDTLTGKEDGWVDFDRIADGDQEYVQHLRNTSDFNSKELGMPIWGTTELHTSIQTGARNFCREKYGEPNRKFHSVDVCEWVANFRDSGVFERLFEAEHMQEAYRTLTSLKGIGDYYGFHGSASTSVLPFLKYHNDQRFVAPGPGACFLIKKMWPEAPRKLYPEAIYFLRERGDEIGLTEDVLFHPDTANINDIFEKPQNGLRYYGTEVAACQFGIYLQIREDPEACERRKVSRLVKPKSLEEFF